MSAIEKLFEEYDKMADYLEEGDSSAEAHKELVLLRELAFERAKEWLDEYLNCCNKCCRSIPPKKRCHAPKARCEVARILRTDPERAKRMGLGWAL